MLVGRRRCLSIAVVRLTPLASVSTKEAEPPRGKPPPAPPYATATRKRVSCFRAGTCGGSDEVHVCSARTRRAPEGLGVPVKAVTISARPQRPPFRPLGLEAVYVPPRVSAAVEP